MTAEKVQFFRLILNGGFSTERGPFAIVGAEVNNTIKVPFLTAAQNIRYRTSGAWQKIGGAEIFSTFPTDTAIKAMFDYWYADSGTQQLAVKTDEEFYTLAPTTGVLTQRTSGLTAGGIHHMSQLDDLLILADTTVDVPKSWDGTTFQTLAASAPNFAFSEVHKNYLFAAGVAGDESTLFYSPHVNNGGPAGDWDGATAGRISVNPDDGDGIRAIVSHNNSLFIFKGPNRGSIHILEGVASTGDDPFRLRPLISKGLGAVGQNSVFRFMNDVGFLWSDGTIHSLAAVDTAGDFYQTQLSRDIDIYIRENLNKSALNVAWAVSFLNIGIVRMMVPLGTSAVPNQCLSFDYRFESPRWALQSKISANCMVNYVDSANGGERILLSGGEDGHVRRVDTSNSRYEDSIGSYSAVEAVVDYPAMDFGSSLDEKVIVDSCVSFVPKGMFNAEFRWRRDEKAPQTRTFAQTGGAQLDNFILDIDTLGGGAYTTRFMELERGGKFRELAVGLRQLGLNEDIEVYSVGLALEIAGKSRSNAP